MRRSCRSGLKLKLGLSGGCGMLDSFEIGSESLSMVLGINMSLFMIKRTSSPSLVGDNRVDLLFYPFFADLNYEELFESYAGTEA